MYKLRIFDIESADILEKNLEQKPFMKEIICFKNKIEKTKAFLKNNFSQWELYENDCLILEGNFKKNNYKED